MIVDTSALIAILRSEPEGATLLQKLLTASEPRISAGTLLEARMVTLRDGGLTELDALLERAGVELVAVDEAHLERSFDGFQRFGKGRHKAGLNYGDCFAYGLARLMDEPLLCKGDDFPKTDVEIA